MLLHEAAQRTGGYAVGVDVSRSIISRASAAHGHVHFAVSDAWDGQALQAAWDTAQTFDTAVAAVTATDGPALLCVDVRYALRRPAAMIHRSPLQPFLPPLLRRPSWHLPLCSLSCRPSSHCSSFSPSLVASHDHALCPMAASAATELN